MAYSHAEVWDREGNFYTANLRSAKEQIAYICAGGGTEVYEPRFSFQGFRYIWVDAFPGEPLAENFEAVDVHLNMRPTGAFHFVDWVALDAKKSREMTLEVTIPYNTDAWVTLPGGKAGDCGGVAFAPAAGDATALLGSGTHRFQYELMHNPAYSHAPKSLGCRGAHRAFAVKPKALL